MIMFIMNLWGLDFFYWIDEWNFWSFDQKSYSKIIWEIKWILKMRSSNLNWKVDDEND